MNTPLPDLLTVPEAARLLRRTPATLHRWIRTGGLRAVPVGGTKMIHRSDLDALIAGDAQGRAMARARTEAGEPVLTDAQLDLVRRAILAALDTLARYSSGAA